MRSTSLLGYFHTYYTLVSPSKWANVLMILQISQRSIDIINIQIATQCLYWPWLLISPPYNTKYSKWYSFKCDILPPIALWKNVFYLSCQVLRLEEKWLDSVWREINQMLLLATSNPDIESFKSLFDFQWGFIVARNLCTVQF